MPPRASKLAVNDIEREAIILNSAWEMIDGMVNWEMFVKNDLKVPAKLMFRTHQGSRLFVILLGDFLSEVRAFKREPVPLGLKAPPSNVRSSDLTFIFHLRQVCDDPKLGTNVGNLSAAIEGFATWLEGRFLAKNVNLPDIDIVADLCIERWRYIKMCGDIVKHHPARLETNVRHFHKMLKEAGRAVNEQECYLAIPNFFEWFHDYIFQYHSSHIAEFLNTIRWEIFDYLRPEFRRSWHLHAEATPDFPRYDYRVPDCITEPVARAMYWNLMNRVRSEPYIHRFVVPDACKQHY